MQNVTDVSVTKLTESQYVKPLRMHYTQNGIQKNWDIMASRDSVVVMLFNLTSKKLIFVKQFRPTVYYNSVDNSDKKNKIDTVKYPPSLGVTLELCGGIVDKDKPLEVIACEEVLEECGFKVEPSELEKIISFRSDVGVKGSVQTLYYCEVSEEKRVSGGGGIDDEMIELVEMSIEDVEKMMVCPTQSPAPSPPTLFFALTWFLHNKARKYKWGLANE